jgi:hypothetical protein
VNIFFLSFSTLFFFFSVEKQHRKCGFQRDSGAGREEKERGWWQLQWTKTKGAKMQ